MSAAAPLNPKLRLDLPDVHIPWAISPETFAKMTGPTKDIPYKVTQLFPTDSEWAFVWHHFHHQKPTKYSLGKVLIVHDRHQQQAFEQNLSAQEREAPKFPPSWDQEPRAAQRAKAIDRWKESVSQFSPFESMETDGRRRSWEATKILPLFHGTRKETCHSICESGHTYFGKTTLSTNPGDPHSTDDGYFGSGIYFTNSAKYASDIYAQGHLLMSWVSMREPFPFVGDPKQEDMTKLRGKGAYKHYNAHYIPVSPLDPTNPNCPEYYPTQDGQTPTYDEYVVFQKSQTLPRFWIHLTVDALFMKTLSTQPQHVEDLIPHLMIVLQNSHVDSDKKLRKHLNEKLTFLLKQEPEEYLDELQLDTLYNDLQTLLDSSGKVNRAVAKALKGGSPTSLPAEAGTSYAAAQPSTTEDEDLAKAMTESLKTAPKEVIDPKLVAKASAIPPTAFGALKWQQYFGDVGVEPPLPPDIDTILSSPCPFWSGKTVQETHMLVLVPKTVNGVSLTLNSLQELIKKPKQGYATKYAGYWNKAKEQLGDQSLPQSSWILLTKDVLPDTRSKTYADQWKVVESYSQKTHIPYEVPTTLLAATAILVEHVQTGTRLYGDNPWTLTRCQEKVSGHQMAVGGFASGGLCAKYSGNVNDLVGLGVLRKL